MSVILIKLERAREDTVLYAGIEKLIFGKNYRKYAIIKKTPHSDVWALDFHNPEDAMAFKLTFNIR